MSNHNRAPADVPSRPPTTEDAFRALIRAYGLVNRVMQGHFVRFGISSSQWGALRALERAEQETGAGLRLTDLGNRLLVRPPSITGVVDRLERSGLVSRGAATDDLRAKHVSLTPAGRRLVERVLKVHGGQIRQVMGGLAPPEQAQLQQLLRQLGSHLEGLVERQGYSARDAQPSHDLTT